MWRFLVLAVVCGLAVADAGIVSPEQFLGFRVGTDKKLVRWDKILEYFDKTAASSDRVRVRDLGKTTNGNRFVLLEISSGGTLRNLDRYKALERKLYFQNGAPTEAERAEIFRDGKSVVMITASVHATEIGATQMVLELVHRLATEDSPQVKKILDNTILLLVPCLNPDGQIMITDWYNKNVGTPFEPSPLPGVYHPYAGHDNNRDMYMFELKESQMTAKVLWQDWMPSIWLDEHQQGSSGARIFVMPATDPINPNVHPLIYRWNNIMGQSQAAALEAEGKEGIIYNSTYTNFWEGAMAWSGWWHNQIGLLTEVASARIATPIEQKRPEPGGEAAPEPTGRGAIEAERRRQFEHPNDPLPAPRDLNSRTEYPRPWKGGTWRLRDIVDYELTATMALLDTAAGARETILRQVYAINQDTLDKGAKGEIGDGKAKLYAILIPHPHNYEAIELVDKLRTGGVEVHRAAAEFEADGKSYAEGTFVVPMNQVFARYAKDMLEKQTYPEVKRSPTAPAEAPYDISGWSLGMQLGAETVMMSKPLPKDLKLEKLAATPKFPLTIVNEEKERISFAYEGAESAVLVNRMLKGGARLAFQDAPEGSRIVAERISPDAAALATKGFSVIETAGKVSPARLFPIRAPRVAMYQSWTSNMDEGWTRLVFDRYEFPYKTLHNADVQAGKLHEKFDVLILPDQRPKYIMEGLNYSSIRPEYKGGIGDKGMAAIREFLRAGGTLIAMGDATDLVIEKFPIPVRDVKKGLTREQHFAPGSILNLEVDTANPLGRGTLANNHGFYLNSPFFQLVEGFSSQRASVVARYPNTEVLASGWLRGEDYMTGRAAVVAIEMNPGRIVLFGIRPQHRAQTHATLPLLFNAIYWPKS
jgi:hypothetical protein